MRASAHSGAATGRSGYAIASRIIECTVIFVAFATLCWRAQDPPLSQTALSRLASVVSLTQDGTWYIDRPASEPPNPFESRTIDKVAVRDRLISSKPPLMPWIMAWEYRALRGLFGWTLDNMEDTRRVLYAYTLTFCVLPWTAALMAATALLRGTVESPGGRLIALLALAFGSQVFGFGAVFNNHVPAAAALLICTCLVLHVRASSESRPVVAAAAGLLGGFTLAFDVPNGIYVVALGLMLMATGRIRNWIPFGLAAAVPVAMQSYLLFTITGSPEPVQLHPELYFYESSYWRNPLGVDAFSEPKGRYLSNMTFGNRGIFLLYPVLLVGAFGFGWALIRTVTHRAEILIGGLCFGIVLAYYTLQTNNYGGEVYGMRWLIPSMPVLVLMGLPVWRRAGNRAVVGLLVLALGVSAYSAWQCGASPWTSGQEWTVGLLGRSK